MMSVWDKIFAQNITDLTTLSVCGVRRASKKK